MMENVLLAIQDFNSLIKDFVDLEIVSISLPKAGHAMRALAAFNLLMECVWQLIVKFGKISKILHVGNARLSLISLQQISHNLSQLPMNLSMEPVILDIVNKIHVTFTAPNAILAINWLWMVCANAKTTHQEVNVYAPVDTYWTTKLNYAKSTEMSAFWEIIKESACNVLSNMTHQQITMVFAYLYSVFHGMLNQITSWNVLNVSPISFSEMVSV